MKRVILKNYGSDPVKPMTYPQPAPLPPLSFACPAVEGFRFDRLTIEGIDNTPVLARNDPAMAMEEICLFHRDFASGDAYIAFLHQLVEKGIDGRRALSVVRFADGEYAFYQHNLACNGLYQQAESRPAIKKAMPFHIASLKRLSLSGVFAPLIFPGNAVPTKRSLLKRIFRPGEKPSAATFLTFLSEIGIALSRENYLPFYAVYAYLTSAAFARLVHGRRIGILNSEYNEEGCRRWFTRFGSRPELVFCPLPAAYLATRWEVLREAILARVPPGVELCLVGGGIGALPVCVDVAERFSVPALDAGHVLNMMNEREDKSKGPRLYTMRKIA